MKGYLPILITLLMFGCGRRPNTVRISYLQNDTLTEEPEILISADRQKDSIVYIPYDSIFIIRRCGIAKRSRPKLLG